MSDQSQARIAFIVLAVIGGATLIPWLFFAFLTGFAFDAPGSEKELSIWLMVIPIWIYPVILLAFNSAGLILYRKNKLNWALGMVCVPLAAIILYIIAMAVYISTAAH